MRNVNKNIAKHNVTIKFNKNDKNDKNLKRQRKLEQKYKFESLIRNKNKKINWFLYRKYIFISHL